MTTKTAFEPVQLFVDEPALEKEKANIKKYLKFLNDFSEKLEKEGILLDDELLQKFSENGVQVITDKIMSTVNKEGNFRFLSDQLLHGASIIASQFNQTFKNLHDLQGETHLDLNIITVLNGVATMRGGVLEDVIKRNTVFIKTPEKLELHEKLTKFAEHYNDLKKYIKENHPECQNLPDNLLTGINDNHHFMGKLDRDDCYMVNNPNADYDLMVNPLFFGRLK